MLPQCTRKPSRSALLGVALLVPFVLRPQQATTRPVTIQVCDQVGAPIAHAQIRLVPAPDPASTKLETDEHGNLSLNLKAGGYALVVSAQGFKNWSERIYVATPSGEASTNQLVPVVLRIGDFGSPIVYPKDSLVHAFDPYTIKGKVFRSDFNEAISNSYILLMQEKDSPLRVEHFDGRTDEKGDYRFRDIPAGKYTVSIYAWFRDKGNVPCQNPLGAKTVDGGKVTVEWQWKSQAFMEIVTIKEFSVDSGQQKIKDFDLFCK